MGETLLKCLNWVLEQDNRKMICKQTRKNPEMWHVYVTLTCKKKKQKKQPPF